MRTSVALLVLVLLSGMIPGSFAAEPTKPTATEILSLDGDGWRLATDPSNVGRTEKWFEGVRPEAKPTRVPWIIEDAFPGYDGVVWYWKKFRAPANPNENGPSLLKLWAVDFKADVWLNGQYLGGHEGGETPFTLDATSAARPGEENLLAVRVLNPGEKPIDDITLLMTPHHCKVTKFFAGRTFNHGGIVDSVEWIAAPSARIVDLWVRPDVSTGVVSIEAILENHLDQSQRGVLECVISPSAGGHAVDQIRLPVELKPGENRVETTLTIKNPRLWDTDDPFLYRVDTRLGSGKGEAALDCFSVKTGFREFVFKDGFFRLNGKRIFLKCSHSTNQFPIGLRLPHEKELARRDLINCKTMGFNAIRFIAGMPYRYQLELADELGLMVYEEAYSAWDTMADSPQLEKWWNDSTREMILRDRNHPSVVIWGLLNECPAGRLANHAAQSIEWIREIDDTRMLFYNSGRWDMWDMGSNKKVARSFGTLCNPGERTWDDSLDDHHPYLRVPHTADVVDRYRTVGSEPWEFNFSWSDGQKPYFLSECGIGSAVNWPRVLRLFDQNGYPHVDDRAFYQSQYDKFLADYRAWNMEAVFGRPEQFFIDSIRRMAGQRTMEIDAIRSNPWIIGYSLTGTVDQVLAGEGLTTTFRELKPGTVDAIAESFAKLRWCTFVEPLNLYAGDEATVEAVLANEDVLKPGDYPARVWIFGPENQKVFEQPITVTVPEGEPSFVLPVFKKCLPIDGPTGKYRLVVALEEGAAAAGGETEFYVFDRAEMPKVETKVVLWGEDTKLEAWLAAEKIPFEKFDPSMPIDAKRLILATGKAPSSDPEAAMADLVRRVESGSNVVFLDSAVFRKGDDPTGLLPLEERGTIKNLEQWLYHVDQWAARHPVFDGLQAGGLMDYAYYREIISHPAFFDVQTPDEVIAAANNGSRNYASGIMTGVYRRGQGRFLINTLLVRENLGTTPQAERLLRNMLNYLAP